VADSKEEAVVDNMAAVAEDSTAAEAAGRAAAREVGMEVPVAGKEAVVADGMVAEVVERAAVAVVGPEVVAADQRRGLRGNHRDDPFVRFLVRRLHSLKLPHRWQQVPESTYPFSSPPVASCRAILSIQLLSQSEIANAVPTKSVPKDHCAARLLVSINSITMARMRLWICCLFISASAVAQEKIDFHEALTRALDRSPDYDIIKQQDKISDLSYGSAKVAFLPELDVEAQNGYYNQGGNSFYNQTTPLNPWSNLLGLTLNENLYDNGKSWNELDVARLNRSASALGLEKGRQQILLTVSLAFYDFSLSAGALDLQRQEVETLRQQYRTIQGRYHSGVSSDRDFLRIKAQIQRSEVDLATQEISLENSRQTLRLAVGVKEAMDFVPLLPKVAEIDGLQFPSSGAESTFDYRIADLQRQVSDIHYREVQREDWPRLTLKGSASYNIPQYIGPSQSGVDSPYWNVQALLILDYALWDWGIRQRKMQAADYQRSIEFDNQEKTRQQVSQSLNAFRAQVNLYRKSYTESQQILRDEENVYSSLSQGYRDGKSTYLELITALGDLYASRNQNLSLQFNLLKVRANLAFYQGNLNEVLAIR
jgi:outer membrane protein TolC